MQKYFKTKYEKNSMDSLEKKNAGKILQIITIIIVIKTEGRKSILQRLKNSKLD